MYIEKMQPKCFVAENVPDLASSAKFAALYSFIIKKHERAGYVVFNRCLNTLDLGVPQNRRRLYIVGIRKDMSLIHI